MLSDGRGSPFEYALKKKKTISVKERNKDKECKEYLNDCSLKGIALDSGYELLNIQCLGWSISKQ